MDLFLLPLKYITASTFPQRLTLERRTSRTATPTSAGVEGAGSPSSTIGGRVGWRIAISPGAITGVEVEKVTLEVRRVIISSMVLQNDTN